MCEKDRVVPLQLQKEMVRDAARADGRTADVECREVAELAQSVAEQDHGDGGFEEGGGREDEMVVERVGLET